MSQLYIDHMFTNDPRHRFFRFLKSQGFRALPGVVEHPGNVFCQFIPLQGKVGRKATYLEFADVRSKKTPFPAAGLSFGCLKDLESTCRKWNQNGLKTSFMHKNYEWKKDDVNRLPGWNFAHFSGSGIRSYYPWVTEYEPWRKRKPVNTKNHPNSVYAIEAVHLNVSPSASRFYSKLLGTRKKRGEFPLRGGVGLNLNPSRTNSFHIVVLKCKNLEAFEKKALPYRWSTYKGREAAVIRNPFQGSWDLWIIES